MHSAIRVTSCASGKVCQGGAQNLRQDLAKHQNQHSDGNRDTQHSLGVVFAVEAAATRLAIRRPSFVQRAPIYRHNCPAFSKLNVVDLRFFHLGSPLECLPSKGELLLVTIIRLPDTKAYELPGRGELVTGWSCLKGFHAA